MNMNESEVTQAAAGRAGETPLESWKEIGAYLQRNAVTARRWEREEGLPVHRHNHKSRSSVYAYASEIDAWRASRKVVAEPPPPVPLWRSLFVPPRALAFAAILALCLVMVGNGLRPQVASAQSAGIVTQQVWAAEEAGTDYWGAVNLQVASDGRHVVFADWKNGNVAVRDLKTGDTRFLTHDAGSGNNAQDLLVSPDGKQVAYRWAGKLEAQPIRTIGVDGTHMHDIAVREYGTFLFAWSPDGKQIAAAHYDARGDKSKKIILMSVADRSIAQLKSTGWQESLPKIGGFSSDGKVLVYSFLKNPTGIFVIAVDGSQEVPLVQSAANDTNPVWTPDGRAVVFLSDRSGTKDLWLIRVVDGRPQGAPELLRAQVGDIDLKGFTSDGSLYYGTNQLETDLYSAEFDQEKLTAGSPARITERFIGSNYEPSLSPDGTLLAFFRRAPGDTESRPVTLVTRSIATGEEKSLLSGVLTHHESRSIRWYPDSRSVLLEEFPPNAKTPFRRVDVQTGAAQTIFEGDAGVWSHAELSRDGRTLFYASRNRPSKSGGLGTVRLIRRDLDAGQEKQLYQMESRQSGFYGMALSPDGGRLAFMASIEGNRALVTMPENGGDLKEIYRAKEANGLQEGLHWWGATWTKDGRYILATRSVMSEKQMDELVAFPVEGGEPRVLAAMPQISNPSVSPDGRRILFTGARRRLELWVMRNFLPPLQASR